MAKILVPKNPEKSEEKKCHSKLGYAHKHHHKKVLLLLSVCGVISIATTAITCITVMNIKHNGGKLPWE